MSTSVLITGAGGQLGRELLATATADIHCSAYGRADLDIGDPVAFEQVLGALNPHVVINAAAYTAVDAAESEPERAARANQQGPENLARACRSVGARLIHISTDFVFAGNASQPYDVQAEAAPLSVYGRSKLAGEQSLQALLPESLIIRTGWVYSRFGHNFVKTMLALMAEREQLRVVADQVGTPTWARGLAQAIWCAVQRTELNGIYHWSDAGVCSWYDFAQAIYEEGRALGMLTNEARITPIASEEYPTAAPRPFYSVLDKRASWRDFDCAPLHWRVQLRAMLQDLKDHSL